MSRPVSFRDVIKCLNYLGHSGINEIHLLPRSQDELVKPILYELGIDINKPIYIQAYKHRDMDNNIGIGFRYNGTIRTDREWVNGKHCDVPAVLFNQETRTHGFVSAEIVLDLLNPALDLVVACVRVGKL